MILECQKDKFKLPEDVTYLNCAYMGPTLEASRQAGIEAIGRLQRPFEIREEDFFAPVERLRVSFARLIGCSDPTRIAVTPSASYGVANAARQIRPRAGSNIVIAAEQFPSNVYSWMRLCRDFHCELRSVPPPTEAVRRGRGWNEAILNAIDKRTAAVALAPLHWSDGTLFDLKAIRAHSRWCDALLIVDGSQVAGAMPFNIDDLQPDAFICACYKWLFGPYGMGLAYYGGFFDSGVPIEENWIVHQDCKDFTRLAEYNPELEPRGLRYSSGEHPAFVHIPMQQAALDQILDWNVHRIRDYCEALFTPFEEELRAAGAVIEERDRRVSHIIGLRLPGHVDPRILKRTLDEAKVFVSVRGDAVRISVHVYNDRNDMSNFVDCLKRGLA